ncbi:MAG: TPM domain-containing protein [Fimbriimonadaceae bacterium]|nr:TPM domain-containing protein [Chitinophagales bacterium]
MKLLNLLLLLFTFKIIAFSQTIWTVEALPNPKLESNDNYVCNPDMVLFSSTEGTVNLLLSTLEDTTTSQVAVVAINSIGDEVPKDFATELFRYWGIGQKENNNGLLILLVIDQRRMEFETGYGMEGILTDGICKRIQMEKMVPRAKEGNYDAAVLDGAGEVIKILMNPKYREEIYADAETDAYLSENKPLYRNPASVILLSVLGGIYFLSTVGAFKNVNKKLAKQPAYIKNNFSSAYLNTKYFLLNGILPVGITLQQLLSGSFRFGEFILFAYGYIGVLLLEKRLRYNWYLKKESENKTAYEKHNLYNTSYKGWGASGFFYPLPFLFLLLGNKSYKNKLRNTPPKTSCAEMTKLSEKEDDAFLKDYEITEETIKTVDYDVWKCKDEEKITILRYPNNQTKYTACTKCGAVAFYVSAKNTISAATYDSSGTGEKIYLCKFCNHKKTETFTIAKLTRSSSGGSGGGYSGGGGGGGFGGGSSGGGGAGSSW